MSGFPDAAASNRTEPDSDSHHTWAPKKQYRYLNHLDLIDESSMEQLEPRQVSTQSCIQIHLNHKFLIDLISKVMGFKICLKLLGFLSSFLTYLSVTGPPQHSDVHSVQPKPVVFSF